MKIALIGNQNSGKTTLFNTLTGMNAKIGNWPGVTIEKKVGKIKNTEYEITDLPGIYSLSPYSVEEEISRQYVIEEKPDVIINIVDSTSLERSLYLTTQLLELDIKVIVALNMADIMEKKGIEIDVKKLEKLLGTKVIKISALKEIGIKELIEELGKDEKQKKIKIFDSEIEDAISNISNEIGKDNKNKRFISVKLLEGDIRYENLKCTGVEEIIKSKIKLYESDLEETIATQRYKFIEKVKKDTFKRVKAENNLSDKLDKVFLNKWLAFPIFAVVMFLIYYLSVGVIGSFTVDLVGTGVDSISIIVEELLIKFGTSEWVNSLVVNGIIAGVGAVLGFVPQLIILFICISILETSGYMARVAMLLDKVFRKIGLSGKSLIPFIVGVGCSVPGIMGTRIIENQDEREMTTILTPFIPCSAKLPIIALFAGYFFGENAGIISASLYFFAIIVIIISALLMKKFIYKNTSSTYISELPEYKMPNFKFVLRDVWDKISEFIKRAGSVIFICSIIIWTLSSFSFNFEYGVNIEESMLAKIGNTISWVFEPMLGTKSWGAAVSAIQGIVAKEQVVSSMAIINGLAEDAQEGSQIFAKDGIFGFFSAASAYSFMVFNLFSAPCFGAIAAMKRELGGTKKMFKAVAFQTIFAWILATLVYQIGSRMIDGRINIANIIVIAIIFLIVLAIVLKRSKEEHCAGCPYNKDCKHRK